MAGKANKAKHSVLERYGISRMHVHRWDSIGEELGDPVPWDAGPSRIREWMQRHKRNVPKWVVSAEIAEVPDTPDDSEESGPVTIKTTSEAFDAMIARVMRDVRKAVRSGSDSKVMANLGRDLQKLTAARNEAMKQERAEDDGLVDIEAVWRAIDEIHAPMPDRVEAALLKALPEAQSAIESGQWQRFCQTFRRVTLAEIMRPAGEVVTRRRISTTE